jgi:hypothetical protein
MASILQDWLPGPGWVSGVKLQRSTIHPLAMGCLGSRAISGKVGLGAGFCKNKIFQLVWKRQLPFP